MKIHWTDRAKKRLKLIHDYIHEESPQSAIKIVDRITARSQQLTELPKSGRQVPEYQRIDIREILERPYRIIYIVKSHQINVLTVMHYRQVLPEDVRQL